MKPKDMLMVFAHYGLRKTSMENIADAAGVSRQSIYKRFGSKQETFEWVLGAFLDEIFQAAMQALENPNPDNPQKTVLKVFEHWSGEAAPVVSGTAHGAELLEIGIRFAEEADRDWEAQMMAKLSEFLVASKLAASIPAAMEIAIALSYASKGIMLKSRSAEDFSREMARVVAVVFRGPGFEAI